MEVSPFRTARAAAHSVAAIGSPVSAHHVPDGGVVGDYLVQVPTDNLIDGAAHGLGGLMARSFHYREFSIRIFTLLLPAKGLPASPRPRG
jgi:hypothetical protein